MSLASRGKAFFSTAAASARTSLESAGTAAASARTSLESAAAAARTSVNGVTSTAWSSRQDDVTTGRLGTANGYAEFDDDDQDLSARIAYVAVSRNEGMLAETADRDVDETERDFAIALGRKMIKRRVFPGWDELSTGRLHAIRLPIHDAEGFTCYIVCFNHAFPADRAQAFVQKLSLMLDPLIEKCANVPESREAVEAKTLVILPVLERELERGNSGLKEHRIAHQAHEINIVINENIEFILEREEKASDSATALIKRNTRTLRRAHLSSQIKWGVTVGNLAASEPTTTRPAAGTSNAYFWTCSACTFENQLSRQNCHMCGARRDPASDGAASSDVDASDIPPPSAKRGSQPYAFVPESRKKEKSSGQQQATANEHVPKAPASAAAKADAATPQKEPWKPPESPRTRARTLVGTRLSSEQAARAADLILLLEPFVDGKRVAQLEDIWTFLDVPKPPGNSFWEGDSTAKQLRSKLNRQRLLLHPDKNGHPSAERTFKFLEQCNDRLTKSCMRSVARSESSAEKMRREEQELQKEDERRRREEAQRKEQEEKRMREEEERERLEEERKWQEAESARKAEAERERLKWMLSQKEARARQAEAKLDRQKLHEPATATIPSAAETAGAVGDAVLDDALSFEAPLPPRPQCQKSTADNFPLQRPLPPDPGRIQQTAPLHSVLADHLAQSDDVARTVNGGCSQPRPKVRSAKHSTPSQPPPSVGQPAAPQAPPEPPEPDAPPMPVGKLSLTMLRARGLPSGGFLMPTSAYAMACVGMKRCKTISAPGSDPSWGNTFEFEVCMEDQCLIVTVWSEGWGYSLLGDDFLGRVEIPFLDLEDWSGHVIGRVLEAADPEATEFMEVDLKASMEWY